jgi:acetolactate synthase-1/2/3 large subunit
MATVAQVMVQTLKELGVKYIFGVPSGNWIDYMAAIDAIEGLDFILVSNESSAGFMADICWRLTGNVAACFGTFGPGACNLTTGVCGGYLDRSPIIALTDEMSDAMLKRTTQMNIDHQTLFKPITKWTTRLQVGKVKETLYEAFRIATSEVPGPVHIGLPQGIGSFTSREENITFQKAETILNPDIASLNILKDVFIGSKKPIIVLGITSVRFGVHKEVITLCEKLNIPVVLTPMAKGMIPEDHPCYVGVLSHALANDVGKIHQQADLVIGIGYDPVEVNYEEWMPNVPLVHIDTLPANIDEAKITTCYNVIGNIGFTLQWLTGLICEKKEWDMNSLVYHKKAMFDKLKAPKGSFGPRQVLDSLRRVLPRDGLMTCDVGAHLHLIGQQWITYSPKNQLMTNGCSSMGFAIPAAIAAKLSCSDKEVCCVVGDGGFNMSAGELATASRLNLKIVFVVIRDSSLSLIQIKQELKGYRQYGTSLKATSENKHETLAYFGVPVLIAKTDIDFCNVLNTAFALEGPVIIEAYVDGNEYYDLVLKGNK